MSKLLNLRQLFLQDTSYMFNLTIRPFNFDLDYIFRDSLQTDIQDIYYILKTFRTSLFSFSKLLVSACQYNYRQGKAHLLSLMNQSANLLRKTYIRIVLWLIVNLRRRFGAVGNAPLPPKILEKLSVALSNKYRATYFYFNRLWSLISTNEATVSVGGVLPSSLCGSNAIPQQSVKSKIVKSAGEFVAVVLSYHSRRHPREADRFAHLTRRVFTNKKEFTNLQAGWMRGGRHNQHSRLLNSLMFPRILTLNIA